MNKLNLVTIGFSIEDVNDSFKTKQSKLMKMYYNQGIHFVYCRFD